MRNEVTQSVNEILEAGTFNHNFDASKLFRGISLFGIQSDSYIETKKMILLK